jgi:alpha-N-arabinofuranosidase
MILTRDEEMILTPTYHVFEMYTVHHDALMLPVEIDAGTYEFEGQSIEAVSVSASRDAEGRIHVSLVNMDPNQARTIGTEFQGASVSRVSGRILTHDAINAHNTFERPNTLQPETFDGARVENGMLTVDLPAKSVVVLELE